MATFLVLIGIGLLIGLLYAGRGYWAWVAMTVALLLAWYVASTGPSWPFATVAALAGIVALLFGVPFRRGGQL